jgi:hypothetical protein
LTLPPDTHLLISIGYTLLQHEPIRIATMPDGGKHVGNALCAFKSPVFMTALSLLDASRN